LFRLSTLVHHFVLAIAAIPAVVGQAIKVVNVKRRSITTQAL
jgi:hypothetical protein